MAESSELVQAISTCIGNSETNKLASLFEDPKNTESIVSNCWDIIPVLCAKLDQETFETQPAMFSCCEKLVNKVAELSCPEEALLEFIEQAECPDNDRRFLVLLKPIQNILLRMPDKRGRSLEWCLNLVASHISELPEPLCYKFQGDERVLLDLDPAFQRAVDVYDSTEFFFEPFVEEVSLLKPQESEDKPILAQRQYQRYILAAFLIHLLGKPLVCMHLEYDKKTKNKIRRIAERLVDLFHHVMADIVPILFERCFGRKNINNDYDSDTDPVSMFQFEEKVPILGLSNLMYLVLVEGLPRHCIPSVYSSPFLFQIGLHLSTELLQLSHDMCVWKGLQLADSVISMTAESSISCAMLDLPVHQKFCVTLEKVIVYCDVEGYRKKGILTFQKYVMLLDLAARYQVFVKLLPLLGHAGVKGVLTTMLKDTVRSTMGNIQNPAVQIYRGRSLLRVVKVYCLIPNGPEVDLMDHSDHIISLLNLLWYLAMTDREDYLGLWQYAPYLDRNFIHPLKDALKMSRAHYELKVHQLEEERMNNAQLKSDGEKMVEVAVTVRGEAVQDLSYDDKKQILNVALNKFSIMESLLTNIREIVEKRFVGQSSSSS